MGIISLNLSELDGSNGFAINGINAYDNLGQSVSIAGDINGDGIDDLIIGADGASPNGNYQTGASYVLFGTQSEYPPSFDLDNLDGSNGFAIPGINTGDDLGNSVSGAGDINGDGLDDLIIGADGVDANGLYSIGSSYVLFGSNALFDATLDLNDLDGSNGFAIAGINEFDLSGYSTSSAGDINGDGIDDLIIGAVLADVNDNINAGASYILFGSSEEFPGTLSVSDLDGNNGFVLNGINIDDYSGISVSSAGDINGDGIDDLIIGAQGTDAGEIPDVGASYVLFGSSQGFPGTLSLSELDGSNGFVILGINEYDLSGRSVSSAGDINGDGIDDLIVGAFRADVGGNIDAGSTYVVFGSSDEFPGTFSLSDLDGSNGFILNAVEASDYSGFSTSGVGDINGDGIDDLLVGAPGASVEGEFIDVFDAGKSYVVFGSSDQFPATLSLSELNGRNGFALNGATSFEFSGNSVSGGGDVNGDGIDDLIIGASNADPNFIQDAGKSYVVFGSTSLSQNAPPIASDDRANAVQNTPLTINVLVNDFDPNGDPIALSDFGTATNGVVTRDASGTPDDLMDDRLIYTPDPGFTGDDSFTYTIADDRGDTATATVNVTVTVAPAFIDLSGSNGFVINGINEFEQSGSSISSAGDINGDGIDDLIIGAPFADPNGINGAGSSYVVFGSSEGFTAPLDLSELDGNNGFAIDGINEYDFSGSSVSSAGDINGDGIDDLIIGATGSFPRGNVGKSYVVFGSDAGFPATLSLSELDGSNGFVMNGNLTSDFFGISVSSAGDINGDGIDDLIIGEPGSFSNSIPGNSYVLFGSVSGFTASISLRELDGSNGFVINGINENDRLGSSVSSAGDINGDGIDDLIIGADGVDSNGLYSTGASYVVFGDDEGFSASLDVRELDGSNGFVINGINEFDSSGTSVSNAGDVNGDGLDDLIIGADEVDSNGVNNAGASYVLFGSSGEFPASLSLSELDGSNGFVINGINEFDFSGGAVSDAGDINGDGIDDLIIGADSANPNDIISAGASYVVFGSTAFGNIPPAAIADRVTTEQNTPITIDVLANDSDANNEEILLQDFTQPSNGTVTLDDRAGAVIYSPEADFIGFDQFTYSISDPKGSISSATVTVAIAPPPAPPQTVNLIRGSIFDDHLTGTPADDILFADEGADILTGGMGNDIMFGSRGDDLLRGDAGDDTLSGDAGRDILLGGDGRDLFVLSASGNVVDRTRADVVVDLVVGEDKIGLTAGLTVFDLTLSARGTNTIIEIAGEDTILGIVSKVTPDQLLESFVPFDIQVL